MKNITKLKLKNFQSWKEATINFTKGLNIIIGNSDSGKSALFRAIDSIFTGKLYPDYLRKKEKDVKVELEFNDGSKFVREKNKTKQTAEANGVKFERIGKEVPQDYFDILGKTDIIVSDKKIPVCLRNQDEAYFFINSSDYEKSKIIGSVCGIDLVDKIVEEVNKDIRENNSKIKFIKEQIENGELKVQEEKEKLQEISTNFEQETELKELLNSEAKMLEFLLESFNKLNTIKEESDSINGCKSKLEKFIKNASNFDFKMQTEELKKIFDLSKDYLKCLSEINSLETRKKNSEIFVKTAPNFEDINLLNELLELYRKIKNNGNLIGILILKVQTLAIEIGNLESKKSLLMKDFKTCPLCGGKI
ncbi:MAG: AAA family ATPase [Staphylococcus sp.]|nr:AAA family ATPase [Staphylococcus sp.]